MTVRYFGTALGLQLVLMLLISCEPIPQVSPLNSPLQPSPSPTQEILSAVSNPGEGKAVLTGVIKIKHTDTPMMGAELYLAKHIGSTPDTPMYVMDPSSAPRTTTDSTGRFIFKDISPGRYAIVIWSPFNSFLIHDPKTDLNFTINIQPDQIYDIGTFYESLPQ